VVADPADDEIPDGPETPLDRVDSWIDPLQMPIPDAPVHVVTEPMPRIPRMAAIAPLGTPEIAGCWVAFHPDFSGIAIYGDELQALRRAVADGMSVRYVEFGTDLR
jgi:hypothetical protein